MVNPRVILSGLIERLEPVVGAVRRGDFSAWESELSPTERFRGGKGHLASALLMAKRALASDNEATIAETALVAPTLERTGLQIDARDRRRAGGRKRGAQKVADADKVWAPYVEMFENMVAGGTKPLIARRLVRRQMTFDEFVLPKKGKKKEFPTERTIRERLTNKHGSKVS